MKGAQNRRCLPNVEPEVLVDADLDTLATALYVRTDDLLKDHPHRLPWRPAVGIAPRISDAEMVTLAVMQALLGHASEARWLRFADEHLRHLFPYLPKQPGYNKRLRRLAATLNWLLGALVRDTSVWTDDVWVVDSTPVECARSRETVRRSDLAGWAEYGYCASHSLLSRSPMYAARAGSGLVKRCASSPPSQRSSATTSPDGLRDKTCQCPPAVSHRRRVSSAGSFTLSEMP
jgi:hypothetical protein